MSVVKRDEDGNIIGGGGTDDSFLGEGTAANPTIYRRQ